MSLLVALLLLVVGLALLAGGGELLIRGAVALARLAGLTTAVIGLTIVAFGTSLPELTVSLLAALRDQPDIAVGNVIGSNLFNILAILGATALVRPLAIHSTAVRVDWPVLVVVTAFCLLVIRDGLVDRFEGGVFVLALAMFVAFSVWLARGEVKDEAARALASTVAARLPPVAWGSVGKSVLLVVCGLVLLVLGGRILVDGAVALARIAGLTERVIGITIVAAGTSAPEVAASLVAARRGHSEIAVANLLGSNIFNILGILGFTALVTPVPVSPAMIRVDAWWMLGATVGLFPFMRAGRNLTRLEGGVLVTVYGLYIALLLSG